MILRRFTAGMKRQDWSAVAIELIVVIAGVFIGLQASNWNQEVENDKRAIDFSQRLIDDLREEAWAYQLMIEYNQQVLASAE
ncbi:MAG TPA: hypothetical protein VGO25_04525, partial [Rhodanobacteraceae bacterium]|nr:hypothetical protein [Rhodanobacteraceae bacterium]